MLKNGDHRLDKTVYYNCISVISCQIIVPFKGMKTLLYLLIAS